MMDDDLVKSQAARIRELEAENERIVRAFCELEAENERLQKAHDHQYAMAGMMLRKAEKAERENARLNALIERASELNDEVQTKLNEVLKNLGK